MAGGPPTAAELPAKMRAVQYDAFGGGAAGLKLVEVPVPSPKKNEVLLKLEAATLNPVDWKIQKGMQRPLLPRRLPHIPVTDVAGVVVAVGPGVREFKPGDEVVAMLNILHGGGLAEYAVASEKTTVKRPPGVSAADAAGLPTAARTALVALRAVGARFNDDDGGGRKNTTSSKKQPVNVLVTGASGGVGHYAVQLARAAGLHVTATCGAHAAEAVRGLLDGGEVLDYATPEGAALRSPSGRRYDGVVHCAPVGTRWSTFRPVLADSGATVVDLTPTKSAMLRSVAHAVTFARKRLVPLFLWPNCEDLQLLVGMMADGKLKTVVDSRFPLSQASQAWERSLGGHPTGKIVVEMGHASI